MSAAYGGGTARLSLARAGHVLGAAQLVIDHPRGRLVYAGDWNGAEDGLHPAGDVIRCDELVVTSTFALPIFQFEPASAVLAALVAWCSEELTAGVAPVVLAASPGAAQTILATLERHRVPATARGDVLLSCRGYVTEGLGVGGFDEHDPGKAARVIVASARTKRSDIRVKGRAAFAYASGWATLDARVEQKRADAAFVLADQADGDALAALAAATGARAVHVTYGDARAFALLLRARGVHAVSAHEAPAIDARGTS